MAIFKKSNTGGILNVIRCDEPSYLIHKWRPAGAQPGSVRENAIRWGSSLRVKDGEVAVFVYKQKSGAMQDFIVGPFDRTIKTANFPVLSSIVGLAYGGDTPFQAEIYFINLAQIVQVKFGVPFFDVYDPRLPDFGVPVAVRGAITFSIADYKEFIKLHRLGEFDLNTFQMQIRDAVARYIKDAVANAPAMHNIPLVQIESKTAQINDIAEYDLRERLQEDFGVRVSGVDIGAIELDKSSEGYALLMQMTRDIAGATAVAEAEAKVKDIADKQRIEAADYAETLRIRREEEQYARHMQTQSANIGAFQIEKQTEVGVAGAEALGQMGANGAGDLNLGSGGGDGFNMAALAASMAVGGAVGKNIAGALDNAMGGIQPTQPGATPPPIPTTAYHVAANGQPTGPFELPILRQMAAAAQLTPDTLVWKPGMAEWTKAGAVEELKAVFGQVPPPVPTGDA